MSEHDDSAALAGNIDEQHPWLGLDSFSEHSSAYFHGREEEVAELARRVQRKLLTVLFGQSGLGKTSILRAGLVPRLRPEGYCPVYLRLSYAPDAPPPAQQIKQAVLRATKAQGQWTRAGSAAEGDSLWEFLHHRDDTLRDADGRSLIPLLIFDQFEEIFTLAQTDDGGRQHVAAFLDELADLVENRPPRALEARMDSDDSAGDEFDFARTDYRILIALREDYLAHLEGVKAVMPSITQNRMRLARMNGAQALAAVIRPGGKLVSQEVAEAIVRFTAGGSELVNAEVEPSLLSLICRELNNNRIAGGRSEISTDLLAGSHAGILADFYARALADQPPGVARFIEDALLTEGGYRENLAEERVLKAFAAAGAAPGALATLVNRRLLRIEERLDVRRVELTHDVLCSVVRDAREARAERELREQAQRQLATQRERERATRKALVRARQIAAGCAVLAVCAVAGAGFGYFSLQRAQQTQAMAVNARTESEKLVSYLLDDFYIRLSNVGQTPMLADLADRTAAYYRGLPPALRTADTDRNLARALAKGGRIRQQMGKNPEALALDKEAFAILEPLVKRAGVTADDRIAMSGTLVEMARLFYVEGDVRQTVALSDRAVMLMRPLLNEARPSLAVLREGSNALIYNGFAKIRSGEQDAGIALLREASKVAQGSAEAKADQVAILSFANASGWLQEAYLNKGDWATAEQYTATALAALAPILDQQPNHLEALLVKSRTGYNAAVQDTIRRRPGRLIDWADKGIELGRTLLRIDPGNRRHLDGLSLIYQTHATGDFLLGRISEAQRYGGRSLGLYDEVKPTPFQAGNLVQLAESMAYWAAERGQHADAVRYLDDTRRYSHISTTTPFDAQSAALMLDATAMRLDVLEGRPVDPARSADLLVRSKRLLATASGKGELEWGNYVARRVAQADTEVASTAGNAAQAAESGAFFKSHSQSVFFDQDLDPWSALNLRALALSHLGRHAEARAEMAAVLAEQRGLIAEGSDDQMLRYQMADTLYASAMAQPGAGGPELKEALALIGALPPELRSFVSVRRLRGRVEAALRTGVK